ncbi:uncharacterized protein LOC123910856 [Trifolium pratense]|uniref:uncharacterized protein LOC123910856 n=1 Tax=Trifolium pratense TaxID=57577 RepID=UPI001E690824|nr:uncharacterized protein LOC123910856 [Trifolium pratense]
MATGGCSNKKKAVKIVIITAKYVETDAMSFKSVVQKLTGKHSSDESIEAPKAKREKHNLFENDNVPQYKNTKNHINSFVISDSMFNEYDKLLREQMLPNDHFLLESQI